MAAIRDSQTFRCADQRETDGTFVADQGSGPNEPRTFEEMRCDPALYEAIEKSPEYR
jgi:hypothetical protein